MTYLATFDQQTLSGREDKKSPGQNGVRGCKTGLTMALSLEWRRIEIPVTECPVGCTGGSNVRDFNA